MSQTGDIRKAGYTFKRILLWVRNAGMSRKAAFALTLAAVASGIATVATTTVSGPEGPDLKTVLFLLYVDAVLLLALGAVVARKFFTVWMARRKGQAGSKLQTRLVVLFSLVAVTPAILVAVFAALFLNFGIQAWFSERVGTVLDASREVAFAYLKEHQQNIRADVLAMANDLNRNSSALINSPRLFNNLINTQAALRSLPEAIVIDGKGNLIARSELSLPVETERLSEEIFERAQAGETLILTGEKEDRVRAMVKLDRFVDAYLLVGRFVSAQVLDHILRTEGAFKEYKTLEKRRKGIQITFVVIFALVALLLLVAAAWFGLVFAQRIARPVQGLIEASERLRKGEMSARVQAISADDEIGTLTRAFNRMGEQLETQKDGLVAANRELDERRRFTETVLEGVSAGVIGLDREGRIHLPNRSALVLLDTTAEAVVGELLEIAVPEMEHLFKQAADSGFAANPELHLNRKGTHHVLRAIVAAETIADETIGYVVTFDDVTELMSAQRKAAWADVARRIAHEIKNPLTPIQLSAERLKRKYLKQIEQDPETFALCTDTIVRHVGDIGRMVDEFSSFARMPQPVLRKADLSELCGQIVFMERNRHEEIEYRLELPDDKVVLVCDEGQIARVLTNVLKNAAESISTKLEQDGGQNGDKPCISLRVEVFADSTQVVIEDDGIGFPKENRDRLTDPYVTNRVKGTGLGLAIVKKTMEDHGGDLVLQDRENGGARVKLLFGPAEPSGTKPEVVEEEIDPMDVATDLVTNGP